MLHGALNFKIRHHDLYEKKWREGIVFSSVFKPELLLEKFDSNWKDSIAIDFAVFKNDIGYQIAFG